MLFFIPSLTCHVHYNFDFLQWSLFGLLSSFDDTVYITLQ